MATQNASSWTLAQLLVAAERFTFEDGRADINEAKALIGLVHPFAEMDTDLAAFEKLLVAIAEDGVVTDEESADLAAAIANLRTKLQSSDAVYDARTLGLPKMGILGVQHMFAMFGVIAYTVINACAGNFRRIHWIMYVLTALFIAKYALM